MSIGYFSSNVNLKPLKDRLTLNESDISKLKNIPTASVLGILPTMDTDLTSAINTAITTYGGLILDKQDSYRIDGTVKVPAGKYLNFLHNACLERNSTYSTNTDPVLFGEGSNFCLVNPYVKTDVVHSNGAVRLGHWSDQYKEDGVTLINYNALNWTVLGKLKVNGVQSSGFKAVVIPNAQVNIGSSVANYFGVIDNLEIYNCDIALYLMDLANAHKISNINIWNAITAGLVIDNAYENRINSSFLHTSIDGVEHCKIINGSKFNTILGLTSEPGGATSKSLRIDVSSSNNFVQMHNNVAGGYVINNSSNTVFAYNKAILQLLDVNKKAYLYDDVEINAPLYHKSSDLELFAESASYGRRFKQFNNIQIPENTTTDVFKLAIAGSRSISKVKITSVWRNLNLDDRASINTYELLIDKTNAGTVSIDDHVAINNTNGSGFGVTLNTPTISQNEITFSYTTGNNGTSTTWQGQIIIEIDNVSQIVTPTLLV